MRAVQKPEELLLLTKHLPAEAAEALTWLAEGLPPEEVREALASQTIKEKVDASDIAAALQHPDSRRRFVTLQTDEDLTAILDAPLEKWRVFLHPSQERLVAKAFNGPARVTGGAGTGKTVVAMHRARHLAKTLCTGADDKVLLTTYTGNLAQNVGHNLDGLCGDERKKIEVVHLHAWAVRFMQGQGFAFDVASQEDLDRCWEDALLAGEDLDFDLGFLRQEWERVVQANDIEKEADYLKVAAHRAGPNAQPPPAEPRLEDLREVPAGAAQPRQDRVEERHPAGPLLPRREAAALPVPGGRRGRGAGLPRRGMEADPGHRRRPARTTCSSSGTPTSASTARR